MSPSSLRTLLHANGRLRRADRQRSHVFPFRVDPGTRALRIQFRFRPGTVGGHCNLLTVSCFDPRGFRGAAHRWQTEQDILLAPAEATAGFFSGPIGPGAWRVDIDAHELLEDGQAGGPWYELRVLAEPGGADEADGDARDRLRVPARIHSRPGWYRGDLHSHSAHCDGESTILEMAQAAAATGLDFLALTPHNTTSPHAEQAAWPPGLACIRGMECTTYFGHANVLGTAEWIDWRTRSPREGRALVGQARRRSALIVANHPFSPGNPACTGCRWEYEDIAWQELDALEVWNGPWSGDSGNAEALALWTRLLDEGHRIPAVAGTDNHKAAEYGELAGLAYTWVFAGGLGEDEVLQAVRRGHAFLSSGPQVFFAARAPSGDEVRLPGASLAAGGPISLEVAVRGLDRSATLVLVKDGQTQATWALTSPGGRVSAAGLRSGRWFRLELYEGDGPGGELLAVTNPVYVEGSAAEGPPARPTAM